MPGDQELLKGLLEFWVRKPSHQGHENCGVGTEGGAAKRKRGQHRRAGQEAGKLSRRAPPERGGGLGLTVVESLGITRVAAL